MKTKQLLFTTLLLCCLISESRAGDMLWLSNTPPADSRKNYQTYGMHRLSSIRGKRGSVKLLCWLMAGTSPELSEPVKILNPDEITSLVFSPAGELVPSQVSAFDSSYALSFSETKEGFYNAYLMRQFVHGDTLFVMAAKAELSVHSCRNGHDKALLKNIEPKIYPEHVPFEIVRERLPGEDFHTFIASGDDVIYNVMLNGEAVNGATITLSTQKGWTNTMKTDNNGKAAFQFINDYFSRWQDLNKRNIFYYLVSAEYTVNMEGSFKGQSYKFIHYSGTLSDGYMPSKTMYSSLVWALLIFVFAISLPGIAVYVHRERRKKPFKEIAFHE